MKHKENAPKTLHTFISSEYIDDFNKVFTLIEQSQESVWREINKNLIHLYWEIGRFISKKTDSDHWGKNIVEALSKYIISKNASSKGFSPRNLWRMQQFYETYSQHEKLSTLLTEITWSNHLHILSKTKTIEEKEFYLNLTAKNRYSARDLARIIDSGVFERTCIANQKLSTALTEFPKSMKGIFKDIYVFEYLNHLPENHSETDFRKGLLSNLKKFFLDLGPDFSFIAEEFIVQVGMKDFKIDLLLHHRGLNNLIAVELKIREFHPKDLGQLNFYLEALDRDVKKPEENPSIGLLICKSKDEEVVEYALSRNASPAFISQYETKMIDKELLQKKLHLLLSEIESQDVEENTLAETDD